MKRQYPKITKSMTTDNIIAQSLECFVQPLSRIKDSIAILNTAGDQKKKIQEATRIYEEAMEMANYTLLMLDYLSASTEVSSSRILLSQFAHELRHPLTTMVGFSDIYQRSNKSQAVQAEITDTLLACSENIDHLLIFVRDSWSKQSD